MNTAESNKLIAEFMGYGTDPDFTMPDGSSYNNNMLYDTSWDWLMPVLKRIDGYANEEMSINDFVNYRNEYRMIASPTNYDISYVFEQAVQFIKWYNENK